MKIGIPAIYAWQDMDPGVQIDEVDIPGEGRFVVASRVSAGRATNRYEYAVYNMNSDVSAGAFSIAIDPGDVASAIGFHDVDYHSGEPYSNTDWTGQQEGDAVAWRSTQTYAQNQNANALRWGTMYTFWFESDLPPAENGVQATIGLFKPHTPTSVTVSVIGPGAPAPACPADWNADGSLNDQDFFDWVNDYFTQSGPQGQFDFNNDGFQNDQDFFDFSNAFFDPDPGCNA